MDKGCILHTVPLKRVGVCTKKGSIRAIADIHTKQFNYIRIRFAVMSDCCFFRSASLIHDLLGFLCFCLPEAKRPDI